MCILHYVCLIMHACNHEYNDHDQAARSIEEIIKGRVKEGLWDDVVRREALRPSSFRPKGALIRRINRRMISSKRILNQSRIHDE